jgi:hypothetical protein
MCAVCVKDRRYSAVVKMRLSEGKESRRTARDNYEASGSRKEENALTV